MLQAAVAKIVVFLIKFLVCFNIKYAVVIVVNSCCACCWLLLVFFLLV